MRLTLRDGRAIRLRRPRPDDVAGCDQLHRDIVAAGQGVVQVPEELPPGTERTARQLARFIEREDEDLFLLAEPLAGGSPVGTVDIARIPWSGLRHNGTLTMGVRPGWQGAGLGRLLLTQALGWAQTGGLYRVELFVLGDNVRAQQLYRSAGFQEAYRRRRFLRRPDGSWVDDLVMEWHADGTEAPE